MYVSFYTNSHYFILSKTLMMCSSSSSLAKGMVIFPFPFCEQVICTFVCKKSERRFLSILNSSGSVFLATIFFLPDSISPPFFSICAISSTLRTEKPCYCTSLKSFICSDGLSTASKARACPISISFFCNAICTCAGKRSKRR